VLENNVNNYGVEAYLDAINMRLMQDYALWSIFVAAERTPTVEEMRLAAQGSAIINLGKDGRAYQLPPPQVSESLVRWKAELDARQQLGGMQHGRGNPGGDDGVAIRGDLAGRLRC
jgi:hypothetical protein